MKVKKERITPILRLGYKNKLGQCQVFLNVQNYSTKPIRISVFSVSNEILHLKPNQLKNGTVLEKKDAYIVNSYLNKLITKTRFVLDYLKFTNNEINKTNIENYLYYKYSEVVYFFENVTDAEDLYNYFKSDEQVRQEVEQGINLQKELGIYRPTGFLECLEVYNLAPNRTGVIINIISNYCKSQNITDIRVSDFTKEKLNLIVRHTIENTLNNKKKYYKYNSLRYFVQLVKTLLGQLKDKGFNVDENVLKFELSQGKQNSHLKYKTDDKQNIFTLNKEELNKIKLETFSDVKNIKQRERLLRAKQLFLIQTYCGGLRESELCKITKDSFKLLNGRYVLYLQTQKTTKLLDTPLHNHLLPILQSINFEVDKLIFRAKNNKPSNAKYNKALRDLAKHLELNREFMKIEPYINQDEPSLRKVVLKDIFCSKFARKALVSILFYEGYSLEQIATITKHTLSAIQYYCALIIDEKETMINSF